MIRPGNADELFLKQLIDGQRSAVKYHLVFAGGIVVAGIGIIVAAFLWEQEQSLEGLKTILGIGGGLVSSLSGFQVKEIFQRKERINVLETLKIRIGELEIQTDSAERARLKELLWKIIEKTAIN